MPSSKPSIITPNLRTDMLRAFHTLLLLIPLLFTIPTAYCQDKKNISGNFDGYSFPRLVEHLENTTHYTFYYDPSEVDSVLINIRATNITLRQLLDQVFQGTALHYAIDSGGR